MERWTQKEKDMLLGYIWADDSELLDDSIAFAIYMLHNESGFDFPQRTLASAKTMYYKETNRKTKETLIENL